MSDPQIVINEVGLRDGLQSQPRHLSLDEREAMAHANIAAEIRLLQAQAE